MAVASRRSLSVSVYFAFDVAAAADTDALFDALHLHYFLAHFCSYALSARIQSDDMSCNRASSHES